MPRKQLVQLHVKDEVVGSSGAPAFDEARLRYRVEGRVHFYHFKMLRVPPEPFARRHSFRIPTLDESRIRPARRADENFVGLLLIRFLSHVQTGDLALRKASQREIGCGGDPAMAGRDPSRFLQTGLLVKAVSAFLAL